MYGRSIAYLQDARLFEEELLRLGREADLKGEVERFGRIAKDLNRVRREAILLLKP